MGSLKNRVLKEISVLWMVSLALLVLSAVSGQEAQAEILDLKSSNYKTPLSGQGFDVVVFGEKVTVPPRNRRNLTAWDLGAALVFPGATQSSILPVATLFFWRRPPSNLWLFRAVTVGLYNEIMAARTISPSSGFEFVTGFENLTIPFVQSYYVQGRRIDDEELISGWARGAAGLGIRKQLTPFDGKGENDNMFEWNLLFEPGYFYFKKGSATAADYLTPQNHLELRAHSRMRYDALQRNLLELPHHGFAVGADAVQGYRTNWRDWGLRAQENRKATNHPGSATAYILRASSLPGVKSERHRLLTSLHAGLGWETDRFSQFSIGGGPTGEEFYSIARPILPGAFIYEFLSSRYAIAITEYRWEPIFFLYLSARASVSLLDRQRIENDGRRVRQDDWLTSFGGRITSGFIFDTRLQIDYNYNPTILRFNQSSGIYNFGGHELVAHVSGEF